MVFTHNFRTRKYILVLINIVIYIVLNLLDNNLLEKFAK